MKEVKFGQEYKNIIYGFIVEINNITRRGTGFQVTYKQVGASHGLITSRGEFLRNFKLIE